MTSKEVLERSINALNYKKSQNEKLSNVDEERLQEYRVNLDKVFPIGSIYIGDENKNPEEIFFGGKWENIGAYIYKGLCHWKRIA